MRILYDSKNPFYKDPFGPLKEEQECRVRIRIPESCCTLTVEIRLENEAGRELAFPLEKEAVEGPYGLWSGTFSLSEPGLFFYRFFLHTETTDFSLFKQGYDQTNMEAGEKWQLSCLPKDFHVPGFYAGKVMYQIFPDRFCRAGHVNLHGKLKPYTIHERETETPQWRPDQEGRVLNNDFFGGTLRGVEKKLPYLASLGVSVLYLNPIFKAFSNHRYDTADYKKIDEMLGTERQFRSLCRSAHEYGMRVILDGVFSHTGSNSRYFDKEKAFGGHGAYCDPASPYRSWYEFQDYPDRYTAWWGIDTLPCVNELDESFLRFVIDGEDSVIAHWLRAGADGFRLDVADELPDAFIARLRRRMKEIDPQALLIGEVWEDASNKCSYNVRRRYFTGGELDSVMNYPFRRALIDFVTGRDGGEALRDTVMSIAENYPPEVLQTLMNFLSTHDTPRILTLLGCPNPPESREDRAAFRLSPESRELALKRLFCAAFLQFSLPGMPCLYYGDEIGMEGFEDPFCRGFFEWETAEESPLPAFFSELSSLRAAHPALWEGSVRVETNGAGVVAVARQNHRESLRAVVNASPHPATLTPTGEILFSHEAVRGAENLVLPPYGFFMESLQEERNIQ